jgi:hypothetical protein
MKQLTGKWKYSKKRGAWIMKWKRRKVRPLSIGKDA